ncbi:hypothetical protein [Vibrio sp. NH-UV-68]|uniref:hypothetical protein n=1 Tax=unclassified Vibrio TaxID=2614977 RepID=UPI0036F32AB7
MFKNNKILLSFIASLALTGTNAFAENTEDPSDVASAVTSFTASLNNGGDVKGQITYSFNVNESQQGMVALEGTMNDHGKYKDSRLQYFHVFDLGNPVAPKVAASLDMVDNDLMSTAAVGAVVAITPVERFAMYIRVGALTGQYSDEVTQQFNVADNSANGVMAAGYFTVKTGNDGTYFMVAPEYTYVDGDVETSALKTTIRLGTPLNDKKTHWGELRLENNVNTLETASKTIDTDDTVAWFNFKAYF